MKDSGNRYIFFLIAFILLWNPFSFYLYYANSEIYHSKTFRLLFWVIPFLIFLLIILIKSKKIKTSNKLNIILSFSFFGILFGFAILINTLLGYLVLSGNESENNKITETTNSIFEPNTVAHYNTVEFNYKAEINSLGLRNKEFSTQKDDTIFRILCFGDSWTFGWGVEIEDSWPMQLEEYLHTNGHTEVEVINCGSPGQFTTTYKKHLSELAPILKPDLILIGVLQLDDLAQLYENNFFKKRPDNTTQKVASSKLLTIKNLIFEFVNASLGNYLHVFRKNNIKPEKSKEIDIKKVWMQSTNELIKNFNSLQQLRFSTFEDTIQTLFKTGNLNSALLDVYINYPDRISIFNNPKNRITLLALDQLNEDIKEMKEICKKNNTKLIFLNLPMNDFVGHKVIRTSSDILIPFWVANNKIDSMYQSVALKNQIPYLELTNKFIQLKEREAYFYLFDGHPNKKGYKEIATSVGDFLLDAALYKNN